jgi:hypothetical protein
VIEDSAFSHSRLESLHIPSSITTIGNAALSVCRSLAHVKFVTPSSLRVLKQSAFTRCPFVYFELPASVERIESYCFLDCDHLCEMTVPESSALTSIGTLILRHTKVERFTIPAAVRSIAGGAFAHCPLQSICVAPTNPVFVLKDDLLIHTPSQSLIEYFGSSESLSLPPELRDIAASAFDGIPLRSLTLNEGLASVNPHALAGLSLDTLTLPGSCPVRGFPFAKCTVRNVVIDPVGALRVVDGLLLTEGCLVRCLSTAAAIAIPGDVAALGPGCFFEHRDVREVTFTSGVGVVEICELAFYFARIRHIVIPRTVRTIGRAAFARCSALDDAEFELPAQIASIGEKAFYEATLRAITIPRSVIEIADAAFAFCDALATVAWEDGTRISTLPQKAFFRAGLTTVTIPPSVGTVGERCFGDCFRLRSVVLHEGESLATIGAHAFANCRVKAIEVPSTVREIGEAAIDCKVIVNDESDNELRSWAEAHKNNLKLPFVRVGQQQS